MVCSPFSRSTFLPAIDHCVDYESSGECRNCADSYVEVADDLCCPEIHKCKCMLTPVQVAALEFAMPKG